MTEIPSDVRLLSQEDYNTFRGRLPLAKQDPLPLEVHYIHIPKTGGDSVMLDSPDHLLQGQTLNGNKEYTYLGTKEEIHWGDEADPNNNKLALVFLRNPATHILSQFLECKYDEWGKRVTKGTGFPGYGSLENVMDGFDEWIAHFALNPGAYGNNGRYAYNCYDPWNMQTRFMALKSEIGVHYCRQADDPYPALEVAKSNLQDKALLIGITEYFSASMCLLENHATEGNLTQACRTCDPNTHKLFMVDAKQHRVTHGVPNHSVDMITNETTIQYILNLTKIDQELYDYALTLFHDEINMVQNRTGMDLLCREQSEKDTAEASQNAAQEDGKEDDGTKTMETELGQHPYNVSIAKAESHGTLRPNNPKEEGASSEEVNNIEWEGKVFGIFTILGMLLLLIIRWRRCCCFHSAVYSSCNTQELINLRCVSEEEEQATKV